MLKNNGQGGYDKYCDWCGKYCGPAGVDSFSHNFCSERCKRSYDNAHGTVDGGYKSGSIGHGLHNTVKKIEKIIVTTITIIFVGALVLAFLVHLFNK